MKNIINAYDDCTLAIEHYDASGKTADDWKTVNDAQNAKYSTLKQLINRDDYETLCSQLGVEPETDEQIRKMSYTLKNFDMPSDRVGWLTIGLMRQRLNGIESQAAKPQTAAIEYARCSECGAQTPKNTLMNASLKSGVCPDCYDRMSD